MQWEDRGIILSAKRFGESSALVTTFTQTHGKARGLLKGGFSKSKRALIEPGTIVDLRWSARLSEQLGQWSLELVQNPIIHLFNNHEALLTVSALCEVCTHGLAEGESHPHLYETLKTLLTNPTFCDAKHYVHFEVALLQEAGFALKLDQCVVTGQENDLCYVSPKSGSAVSREAGKPYANKLFPLPEFLKHVHLNPTLGDLIHALTLTDHFLRKHVWSSLSHREFIPAARDQLVRYCLRRQADHQNKDMVA